MSEIRVEIQETLDAVARAVHSGVNVEDIAKLLYMPDMLVVGEGWPGAIRSIEAFLPDFTELVQSWGPEPELIFTLVDPLIVGSDAVTSLVDLSITCKDPSVQTEYLRIVYAWVRYEQGWRVKAEMYTVGSY
ncbi:hypothetical protein FV139_14235 [Parahaliea maris]|uniref:SnoaL-like domain-containing protein n=1 Tax=Parahaliea maris TaxID=2716870 RepID=A0A5C8ZVL6_9GAMM|nr:hypothetical protein [Parahaliea maris]TXS91889.1 hypothetical protein FV139_14235 [Parahaliea maris]